MAATAARVPLHQATATAEALLELLDGSYVRAAIAGSIRRRSPTIGDVEIVAVPRTTPILDLFDEEIGSVDQLGLRVSRLRDQRIIEKRPRSDGTTRWGARYKALTFQGLGIDLFVCDADRFGWILMLRTGPAAFSRQLVQPVEKLTQDHRPGLLPPTLLSVDGWLCWAGSHERIATPDEDDVWRRFGLDPVPPSERR